MDFKKLEKIMKEYNRVYDACWDLLPEGARYGYVTNITFFKDKFLNEWVGIEITYDNDENPFERVYEYPLEKLKEHLK